MDKDQKRTKVIFVAMPFRDEVVTDVDRRERGSCELLLSELRKNPCQPGYALGRIVDAGLCSTSVEAGHPVDSSFLPAVVDPLARSSLSSS